MPHFSALAATFWVTVGTVLVLFAGSTFFFAVGFMVYVLAAVCAIGAAACFKAAHQSFSKYKARKPDAVR